MSNNTTGCTSMHMVPIERHLNPVNIAMQPFGRCTPTCPAGAQDDNASILGCGATPYSDATAGRHCDMAGVIT